MLCLLTGPQAPVGADDVLEHVQLTPAARQDSAAQTGDAVPASHPASIKGTVDQSSVVCEGRLLHLPVRYAWTTVMEYVPLTEIVHHKFVCLLEDVNLVRKSLEPVGKQEIVMSGGKMAKTNVV